MTRFRHLRRDERGATAVETAFALPALIIIIIYMIIQLGFVFRAMAGIQHSLGEGARLATIFPTPNNDAIQDRMEQAVFGIEPGEFGFAVVEQSDDPATTTVDESDVGFFDLTVTYTQPTSLLLLPGPTIEVERTKRVWVADD